ncbi:UDP-N-acetylmuramoyl-L-alanine--D-glutamate ligase [Thioalkalivibrio sp. XN8]|uniref:UDP-N-acetylmuramoyl-L-alanine--D-glutamate ligase n=1 Tax=Thioalkalivibrio sp. XN8 TaxID=2712863 RepID=UPI0013E9F069|nr:UDP-N-acetylmuramoyl-L-alanine--D-glutamate ligase [Thioalkalivibrio sp. XN8]NGP52177.1 UDP-N-acetylmuramoyl-L-alanine--D-glutamate ligase [Thioalkalivibrio sp. XN8]
MIAHPEPSRRPRAAAQPVLVVGLGATGLSCARYLARLGQRVRVVDSRAEPPGLAALGALRETVELRLGGFDKGVLDGVAEVVVSPGVSLREPLLEEARRRGLALLGDIELFARAAPAPVAAITGSNGKSTVTSLLAELARAGGLRVREGGNLGTPALDLLEGEVPDVYVLELSSFQLEATASLRAKAACVLNLSADHIDRHGSMEAYAEAKARILHGAERVVLNRDDRIVMAMWDGRTPCIRFGLGAPAAGEYGLLDTPAGPALARGEEALAPVSVLRVRGRHNQANALAALAMVEAVGLDPRACLPALAAFRGLPHRAEWIAERGGVEYINDSKGTNVGAAVAAIQGMDRPVVLIAGGDGKGADFAPLAAAARERVHAAVLLGQDAPVLEAALAGTCRVERVDGIEAAVVAAARLAQPGDCVLLSPACASTDMYRDYRERGQRFAAAVRELPA